MPKWQFTKGLHDLGTGAYAYLQPDGSTGLSNAGLIVDGKKSLLVDTLMDLPLTREMLDAMRGASTAARSIDILVNTHANLDHTFGNQLVEGAEIIASAACAAEMLEENPYYLDLFRNPEKREAQGMASWLSRFDFRDIVVTPPTRTFEGERLSLPLHDKTVEVIHVGPAHTKGDVLVYSPSDKVVYTGDILFVGTHPVIWVGPWDNWTRACNLILEMDVEVVVPGHGPITDKHGVSQMLEWIEYLRSQARARYDAGLSLEDTLREFELYAPFDKWLDRERIVNNVNLLFKEFGGRGALDSFVELQELQEKLGLVDLPSSTGEGSHGDSHHD